MKKIFTAVILGTVASLLSGADWTSWKAEGNIPEDQLKIKDGLVTASPNRKLIHFFDRNAQSYVQGTPASIQAELSGNGKVIIGCHFYDKKLKWLGKQKEQSSSINSTDFKKFSVEIQKAPEETVKIRPYLKFLSGTITCKSLSVNKPEGISKKNLAKTPVFKGWMYNTNTKASFIRISGDGTPENSILTINTAPQNTVELYPRKPEKVKENDMLKFRFETTGSGSIQLGIHLYDAKNVWLGVISKTIEAGKSSEITLQIKTPAGKKPVTTIRPFIRVHSNANVTIGKFRSFKRELTHTKPEVEIPIPEGFQLIFPEKADFPIRFFASENKIVLDMIETPYDLCADQVVSAKFSAVSSDGKVIGSEKFPFEKSLISDKSFSINKDFTGTFTVIGEFLDKNGKVLITGKGYAAVSHLDLYSGRYNAGGFIPKNTHLKNWVKHYPMGQITFHREHFPFEKVMKEDHGFPGFQPIQIKGNSLILSGRTYTVNTNGFLSQAEAFQQEPTVGNSWEKLFAAPVNLTVDGKEFLWKRSAFKKEKHAVLWTQTAQAAGAEWVIENRLEPDGVLKMSFTVIPGKTFRPEKVSLRLPLKQDQASLYQNITDVTYRKLDRSKKLGQTPLGGFAGYTPSKKIRDNVVWESKGQERKTPGSFQPFVWFGNEDRGFCYFSDSGRDWNVDDSRSALEISRENNSVILNINFINHPVGKMNRTVKWDIGLLATPVKAPLKNWRGTVFPRWMTMDRQFYDKLKNVRKLIFVSAGHPKFTSGTQNIITGNIEQTKKMYADVADKLQSSYLEYYCSDELNINTPEMKTYFSEWACPPYDGKYRGHSVRRQQKSFGLAGATAVYQHRFVPSYIKYRGWAIGDKLKKIGLLSFYEDNIHVRGFFDSYRKKGYTDNLGRRVNEYDLLNLREHYHFLAYQYKKNNYENLTGAHASASLLIPALTNCAFFIDGEQPGRYDNSNEKDYIDHWKDLDYMRAVSMGRAFGINTIFLSEMVFKGNDEDGHHSRAWLALILPHDIAPWDGATKNREPIRQWHKIVNDLDFYSDSPRLYPYWAKGKFKVFEHNHKDLLVTVWKQKKRTVIMLSNMGEKGTFQVKLLPEKLGIKSFSNLKNVETKTAVPIRGNTFTAEVPRHDFRIFVSE